MHARRVPDERDAVLQSDQCRRQPVACRVMNRRGRRAVSGSDFFVKPDNESTSNEDAIELASYPRQLSQRGDCVRPVRRRPGMVRESVELHRPQPLRQLCLGDQREKQVAIVLNVKRAKQTYLQDMVSHLRSTFAWGIELRAKV